MSADYGASQHCPDCSGALIRAERRMVAAFEASDGALEDGRLLRHDAATERKRAANNDPTHRHIGGRPALGACTLGSHQLAAEKALRAAMDFDRLARKYQRDGARAAHEIATAGRRLLLGCTLCGRGPLPANGRLAA